MAIELYKHNAYAYNQVQERLKTSNRTCVIHPTGSGKSFIAIKWLYENRHKKCLFLTSQKSIIDQIKRHIVSCGLTLDDFPNLKFDLYQNMTEDIAKKSSYDCIVLDEFHRCGAPEWGRCVDTLLKNNSNAKVLGFSATPIRYLDDCRNMAEELFDNNIASEISLVEAVSKGILPLPTYINALYSFDEDIHRIQSKINKLASEDDKKKFQEKLDTAKKLLEKSEGLEKIFSKYMTKRNGKYIVFCRDTEHMNKMMEEAKKWFGSVNSNIDMYSVISSNSDAQNQRVIDAFENSNNGSLKLLFCVNMLNEGLHVNDIDGVIMLRPTSSPTIYLQQLGRALSVGHNKHPLIFDIVNNSLALKDFRDFYDQVRHQIHSGTSNPALSGYDDIDLDNFKVVDEMSSMIDLINVIDKSLNRDTFRNSKAKKLFADLIALGHQPNRNNSKYEASLYTALISHGREWFSEEQLTVLNQLGIYIPKKLDQEDLSLILFNDLKELGHQPSQSVDDEKNLYSRLVQRGSKYLTEEQLKELSRFGIYIPQEKTKDERGEQLFNELIQFGRQPSRTSKNKDEVNLYGRLQRHGKDWLSEEQMAELSKKGITIPKSRSLEEESVEFFNELMALGHQPKKSNPAETSLYKKLQRRGSSLLTLEQKELLAQVGIKIPVKLEESDYIDQTFCSLVNLGHYPSASKKEEHALYTRVYKWKDKFTEEQKQILSYLGFTTDYENVDFMLIVKYLLDKINQEIEKGNPEMVKSYKNILVIINQQMENVTDNVDGNNPHHM